MNTETENRIISFVRSIANACRSCLRKSNESCRECPSQWAKSLMLDITSSSSNTQKVDYSLHARILKILSILIRARQPLLSKSIKINDMCSQQLKLWTLKKMCKHGLIRRSFAFDCEERKFYQYQITSKGKKYYENYCA